MLFPPNAMSRYGVHLSVLEYAPVSFRIAMVSSNAIIEETGGISPGNRKQVTKDQEDELWQTFIRICEVFFPR